MLQTRKSNQTILPTDTKRDVTRKHFCLKKTLDRRETILNMFGYESITV